MKNKLSAYMAIVGLLLLVLGGCIKGVTPTPTEKPPPSPEGPTQLFEGFYLSDPEVSSFVPCALDELPGEGKGYWLVPTNEFSQLYENPEGITFADIGSTYGPYDKFAIYVRFEGVLLAEPDKGYGHLGLYAGEIQVTRALEASRRWVGSTYPPETFHGCAD